MRWGAVLAMVLAGTGAFAGPEVGTLSGPVVGQTVGAVDSFLGIPYAAPPVGDLRWMAPQPVAAWETPRAAVTYGPDCAQLPDPSDAAPTGTTPSEDCLYLNIWRPVGNPENLPVLLWIHGGGYVNGGASPMVYDGAALAEQGIIVVSLNYRLGRFGFFHHPELAAETGNFALLDMLAGLGWVHRNIAAFGGDPQRLTIWGESAGGDAVLKLMAMPQAEGLFQQAVVMSGGGRAPLLGGLTIEQAQAAGVRFAEGQGISGSDAMAAVRALPAEALIGQLNMSGLMNDAERMTYALGPIRDALVPAAPGDAVKTMRPIPLMIGTTGDDLPVHLPPLDNPFALFGPAAETAKAAYLEDGFTDPKALLFAIGADRTMQEPARHFARALAARGAPVWLYRFDHVPTPMEGTWNGAPHASELPYFFGTLDRRFPMGLHRDDETVMRRQMRFLVNFVQKGDPGWAKVDPAKDEIMLMGRQGTAEMVADPLALRLNLIKTGEHPDE
ncbi:carboxylesterase/lipase family protein [Neogemmobacter tilapiae]|uniref:Carboxylic ester hydrolase n=1 Tax=Neogemmobacter tilapiae TaxID=875041 RepID=A0A918TVF8_9RHOB|nr:carboxylesterase family protein [Gemmobacter tilapiae]GHC63536.1 carboxylic ester hydrolase [Gemmobacter tilapiae]